MNRSLVCSCVITTIVGSLLIVAMPADSLGTRVDGAPDVNVRTIVGPDAGDKYASTASIACLGAGEWDAVRAVALYRQIENSVEWTIVNRQRAAIYNNGDWHCTFEPPHDGWTPGEYKVVVHGVSGWEASTGVFKIIDLRNRNNRNRGDELRHQSKSSPAPVVARKPDMSSASMDRTP